MNKKMIRLLPVITAAVIASSILPAGCANKAKDAAEEASAGTVSQTTATSGERELAGNVYKTGLPIVKDKITLNIVTGVTSYNKVPLSERKNTKAFEERTNIHIEFTEIPDEMKGEKTNIMLASSDLPDGFMRALSNSQVVNNYDSGLFAPLDNLIDEYTPTIKGFLEDPAVKAQLVLPDGKIYATPAGEMAPWTVISAYYYINRDWTDRLGLQLPVTTDDFYNVLKAFKDEDADGDGDKNNEIPFSFTGADNLYLALGAFGVPCYSNQQYLYIKDGRVTYVPADPNFKKAMEYFNKLYKEGLIDQESFSQNVNQLRAKGKNGVLGSFLQFLASSTLGVDKMDEYQAIPPLKGPEGYQLMHQHINGVSLGMVISAKSENKEALIRWVDYLNSPDVNLEPTLGLEEEGCWVRKGDGKYEMNSHKTPEGLGWTEWLSNIGWNTSSPTLQPQKFVEENRVLENEQITKEALERVQEFGKYGVEELLPPTMLDPEVNMELSTIQTELLPLVKDYISKSVMQGVNDAEWNAFQENLKKAKYERYIELWQEVYDKIKKQ